MGKIVPLNRLITEGYGPIVCYPKFDAEELNRRLKEMKQLGIKALWFKGEKMINNVPVLGKGYVGIVVLAETASETVALKIRRTDSGRTAMKHEAEMLRTANSVDVGPRLHGFTENLLTMEFVEGPFLPVWIDALGNTEDDRQRLRKVLRDILEQCWRLDEVGLDHGELSRAPKHIIVRYSDEACILDFETSSVSRRVSNVTSICQFLFMRGKTVESIARRIGAIDEKRLLSALRTYKKNRNRHSFEKVLKACRL